MGNFTEMPPIANVTKWWPAASWVTQEMDPLPASSRLFHARGSLADECQRNAKVTTAGQVLERRQLYYGTTLLAFLSGEACGVSAGSNGHWKILMQGFEP
eukprot:1959930-Amphidinium_carterae.1